MKKESRHFSEEQRRAIEANVKELLQLLGADPESPGLKETPARVTREEIADMFNKCFEEEEAHDLVLIKDIITQWDKRL